MSETIVTVPFRPAQDEKQPIPFPLDPTAMELKGRLLHEFLQATLQSEPMRMPRIAGA